jgi:hypothetical protein
MAGFLPVGSFPVASVPAGGGVDYVIDAGELEFDGFAPSTAGSTSLVNPASIALEMAEVVRGGGANAQLGLAYAEVTRTVANGPTKVRIAIMWAEGVRTVRLGGRKRMAQIIG